MQRTKEDFLEQREADYTAEDALFLRMKRQEEYVDEAALPVINLNELKPEPENTTMQMDSSVELVNMSSMVLADKLITAIVAGKLDPLVFMVKKKLLDDAMKVVAKNPDVKAMAEAEVAKYGKEGAKLLGATITAGSMRKYNYAEDEVWASLKEQVKPIEELMKAQEKLVQAAVRQGKSFEEVDKESGEVKTLAKCVNAPATDFIKVSFKK
jgi:hypothetical protein